jgi:asparagine synthase (glutamine-hydrolysing)
VLGELLASELAAEHLPGRLAERLRETLVPFDNVDAGRRMLLGDLFTYLPDNMLLRSDKVLMAGSLEGRMPLLDLDVVGAATRTSSGSRAALFRPKRALYDAIAEIVPVKLREGPKKGFPVPIESFLVQDGGGLAQELILSDRCLSRGLLDPDATRKAVLDPAGRLSGSLLFVLASLELWARANVDRVSARPLSAEDLLTDEAVHLPAAGAVSTG